MKYLPLYEKWELDGHLDNNGLCNSLPYYSELELLFRPENTNKYEYWAYDGDSKDIFVKAAEFTPLRQNIVLFLAAMNNEL